jgi:amidase
VIVGEVAGSDAADPALIEEFTGLWRQGAARRPSARLKAVPAAHLPCAARQQAPKTTPQRQGAPAPLAERMSYMTVQRPTHAQMKAIVPNWA